MVTFIGCKDRMFLVLLLESVMYILSIISSFNFLNQSFPKRSEYVVAGTTSTVMGIVTPSISTRRSEITLRGQEEVSVAETIRLVEACSIFKPNS